VMAPSEQLAHEGLPVTNKEVAKIWCVSVMAHSEQLAHGGLAVTNKEVEKYAWAISCHTKGPH
jgi:hypothetical protein